MKEAFSALYRTKLKLITLSYNSKTKVTKKSLQQNALKTCCAVTVCIKKLIASEKLIEKSMPPREKLRIEVIIHNTSSAINKEKVIAFNRKYPLITIIKVQCEQQFIILQHISHSQIATCVVSLLLLLKFL